MSRNENNLCSGCFISYKKSKKLREGEVFNFLVSHNVLRVIIKCPKCSDSLKVNHKLLKFMCKSRGKNNKKPCNFFQSIWTNTFFSAPNLGFHKGFDLVCAILSTPPPRQTRLCEELKISVRTFIKWYWHISEIFIVAVSESEGKIGGYGQIVQLEQAKWRGQKKSEEVWDWVFGAIDHKSRCTFLAPVESCNAVTLKRVILQKINPGTIIVSSFLESITGSDGIQDLNKDYHISFVNTADSSLFDTVKYHWKEVRRGQLFPKNYIPSMNTVTQLAEYLFKAKYPEPKGRIHAFFEAVAKFYSPK